MMRHVLEGKEDPVAVDARDDEGNTPLMFAADKGNMEAARRC